jgi:hypothetical protein
VSQSEAKQMEHKLAEECVQSSTGPYFVQSKRNRNEKERHALSAQRRSIVSGR